MKTSILSAAVLALIIASPIQAQNPQGPGPKGGKQQHFLKAFDTDNNGIVTEEEFKTASKQRYQAMDGRVQHHPGRPQRFRRSRP